MTYDHTLSEICKIIPEFTDDIIPLQFIEKKDIKGNNIFDGDIVRYRNLECNGDVSFGTAFVKYEEGEIKLQVISCDIYKDGSIIYMMNELEIIGTIYENPELLKLIKP